MSAKHKEIVSAISDAFGKNDMEGFLSHCTEDVVWTMVGEDVWKGKTAIRKAMASMGGGEPPQIKRLQIIAEGDSVADHGTMTMQEEGKIKAYTYCDLYQFRDDKVAELTAFVMESKKK